MTKLSCIHCGARFLPVPQVPNQTYCSKPDCQKERRRQWQKSKRQSDPDYRDNQSRAQKAWTDCTSSWPSPLFLGNVGFAAGLKPLDQPIKVTLK